MSKSAQDPVYKVPGKHFYALFPYQKVVYFKFFY